MSIEERFYIKNNELQQKVMYEIQRAKKGLCNKNVSQLETILNELRKSVQVKNAVLSYPRLIIDSWDYSDLLGIELVELAEMYKKIK